MDEHAGLSAAETAARIRSGDVSPVEVVDTAIARLEERDPQLNAFVFRGFEDARARALQAERAVLAGDELGPLHGVPVAMKDLFDFKPGWPTTFGGIRALRRFVAQERCGWVERMEDAGAIVVGKTNAPVLGFRGTTDNLLFGPTRNPFDPRLNAGGSSGGSAAAVAAGIVPLAEGTDGGGSVRIPAAWCNLVGMKASFGRVPFLMRPNAFGAASPFLTEGTLSRTVDDAALALSVHAGAHPGDPYAAPVPGAELRGAAQRPVEGLRVAYSPDLGSFPVDPRVARTVEEAVDALAGEGVAVERIALALPFDQRELSDLWCRAVAQVMRGALAAFASAGVDVLGEHRDDLPDRLTEWVDLATAATPADLWADQVRRTQVLDALEAQTGRFDAMVCPTLACLPVPNADDGETTGPAEVEGVEVDPLIGWCLTYLANFTGQPAVSVPAGLVHAGGRALPVGVQITGRRWEDPTVLGLAAALERARPWHAAYALACSAAGPHEPSAAFGARAR